MMQKLLFPQKLFILFYVLFFSFVFSQEEPMYVEGVAAIVGDNLILKSDLSQIVSMTAIQQRLDPSINPEEFQKLQESVLQSLVDQKIVLEMAKLDSIEVKDKDVNAVLDQQIENMVAQSGSEEQAEKMLGQSLKSFRREFWFDMRDRLITEQYQQTLLSGISVSRVDVTDFYSTYKDSIPVFPTLVKLRHILTPIEAGDQSKQRALQLLDSLRQSILEGEDFAQLAESFSQDPGTRSQGGDLGFVRRGSLVQEFETVAFTLEPGELSELVETVFGFHLIELLEKKGEKIHIRHILIVPEITESDESFAFDYAASLGDSATSLDRFKALAAKYSVDDKTKDIGGDLGWIDPNNYSIPEIAQVVPYLTIGESSPPVKTNFGYHLLWMEGIKPGGKANLSSHWNEIEAMALNNKKMQWYQRWITNARTKFYIRTIN